MRLPYLEHTSTRAYIGLNIHRPHLDIRQQQADLQIRQQHVASFKLDITHGEIRIDQSQAFADADLKGILRRNDEFIQRAKQTGRDYVAKLAQEGDQLMKIENDGYNKFAQVAANNNMPKHFETNVQLVPKPFGVKIDHIPGSVQVQAGEAPLTIEVTPREPNIRIPKWQTETYVRQKNSLSFQVIGLNVDRTL